MFFKNFIVKIPPFFDPERLQSVYDALRKMAQNIKKSENIVSMSF